jgi:hypothetical protein
MRKYKLLKFGQCYINQAGDLIIGLLRGDKKHGYQFAGSSAHPVVYLGTFQLLSRIVDNDGNWTEIDPEMYNLIHTFHMGGYKVKLPKKLGEEIVISKFEVVS